MAEQPIIPSSWRVSDALRLGRNYVHSGDPVKIRGEGSTLFRVVRFVETEDRHGQTVSWADVHELDSTGRGWRIRSFRPERIRRVALTRNGARRELVRAAR